MLDAKVYPASGRARLGPAHLDHQGARASPLGVLEGLHILNWHGDTFDLPSGAKRLASTTITPNQAFSYGNNVLALQFHVELPERDMERWLIGHTLELATSNVDLAEMRAATARYAPPTSKASHTLFSAWLNELEHLVGFGRQPRLSDHARQVFRFWCLTGSPLAFHQVEA